MKTTAPKLRNYNGGPIHNYAAMLLLAWSVLLGIFLRAEGTHFRYGTISWVPVLSYNTNPSSGSSRRVEFTMELAYRRDYDWGFLFGEQWSSDGINWSYEENVFENPDTVAGGYVDPPWYLRFPPGRNFQYLPLPNNIICVSPWDTGDRPFCGPNPVETPLNNRRSDMPDSQGNYNFIDYDNFGEPSPGLTLVPCEDDSLHYHYLDDEPDYCSPWSDTYGFFFGDGSSHTVDLQILEVNTEPYVTGNFLRGKSVFQHTYGFGKKSRTEPWLAFFTGGDRINKHDSQLNNNNVGRFRLEVTINVQGANRSPISTSMPVLPVPYTGRNQLSAYGYLATFQIAAFDPDIGFGGNEAVSFYVGNWRKHGALLGNSIPEGAYPQNWHRKEYEEAWLIAFNEACTMPFGGAPNCAYCQKGAGKTFCLSGECGEFNCEDYVYPWDPAIHIAHPPPDLIVEKDTGIVRWETGLNPFTIDSSPYVEDRLDADGNVIARAGTFPNPRKLALQPGFWNLVLDIRSSSHDPCLTSAPTTCTETDALGHISIPLDFLLYLYPPLYMCSEDCANWRDGIPTFRSNAGMYGWSEQPDQVYQGVGTGQCTVCGGGMNTLLEVYNPSACQSSTKNCDGFSYSGDIGRGLFHNCTSGPGTCCPGVVVGDGEALPRPTTPDDYCVFERLNRGCNSSPVSCAQQPRPSPPPPPPPPSPTGGGRRLQQVQLTFNFQTIVPAYGSCYLNTAPYWVDSDCLTEHTPPIDRYEPILPSPRAKLVRTRGKDVAFDVVAADDDACNELSIRHTGLYDGMQLGEHTFDNPRQVRRSFLWPAPVGIFDSSSFDTRPVNSLVCFYPFDNYVVGIFRCVRIVLPTCANFQSFPLRTGMNEQLVLYFRLFDCDDLPITDLDCEDSFVVKENGVLMDTGASEMVCLRRVHAYTLLLDVTSSVQDILDVIRDGAKSFVSHIFDADCHADKSFSIAVFAGDRSVRYVKEFSSSPQLDTKEGVLRYLDLIVPSVSSSFADTRATNLYGAVIEAVSSLNDYIVQGQPTLRHISTSLAVFTDGDDTTNYHPQSAAVNAVNDSPHNVYIIGVGNAVPISTLQALGKSGYTSVATVADVRASFEASARKLNEQSANLYAMGYCPPASGAQHVTSVELFGQLSGIPGTFSPTADQLSRCSGNSPSPSPQSPPSLTPFYPTVLPFPHTLDSLANRVTMEITMENESARAFQQSDVVLLRTALADQLGVSTDTVTTYSTALVQTRLELLDVTASTLLLNSLKDALTNVLNLELQDAVELVLVPSRRRGMLQNSADVMVTVVAELSWETDLQTRMSEATSSNFILSSMPSSLGVTELRVLSAPQRTAVSLKVAIDSTTASDTARVAVRVSRLQQNPKQLADALTAQNIDIQPNDFEAKIIEVKVPDVPGAYCDLSTMLKRTQNDIRAIIMTSLSEKTTQMVNDETVCSSVASSCSVEKFNPLLFGVILAVVCYCWAWQHFF